MVAFSPSAILRDSPPFSRFNIFSSASYSWHAHASRCPSHFGLHLLMYASRFPIHCGLHLPMHAPRFPINSFLHLLMHAQLCMRRVFPPLWFMLAHACAVVRVLHIATHCGLHLLIHVRLCMHHVFPPTVVNACSCMCRCACIMFSYPL